MPTTQLHKQLEARGFSLLPGEAIEGDLFIKKGHLYLTSRRVTLYMSDLSNAFLASAFLEDLDRVELRINKGGIGSLITTVIFVIIGLFSILVVGNIFAKIFGAIWIVLAIPILLSYFASRKTELVFCKAGVPTFQAVVGRKSRDSLGDFVNRFFQG